MLTLLVLIAGVVGYCAVFVALLRKLMPPQSSSRPVPQDGKPTALDRLQRLHDLDTQGAQRNTQDVA